MARAVVSRDAHVYAPAISARAAVAVRARHQQVGLIIVDGRDWIVLGRIVGGGGGLSLRPKHHPVQVWVLHLTGRATGDH